jgi:hypothetical protein
VPKLLTARQNSLELFARDFVANTDRYVDYSLPGIDQEAILEHLPKPDLITIGNCLMAYAGKDEFNLGVHVRSLATLYRELKSGGTIRVFPFGSDGMNFGHNPEASRGFAPTELLDALARREISFRVVESEYRFVRGWSHRLELYK